MTYPLVGPTPYTRQQSVTLLDRGVRWKQTRPYDLVLPFERDWAIGVGSFNDVKALRNNEIRSQSAYIYAKDLAVSAAYERFKAEVSDRAGWGENLAQLGSAVSMIEARAVQITRALKSIRRGKLRATVKVLTDPSVRKNSSVHKKAANQWLEWSFGWSPIFKDIQSSVNILQKPIPSRSLRGRAKQDYSLVMADIRQQYFWDKRVHSGVVRVQMGAQVSVSNPNLWLANSLGLVNPLNVAYNVIPFSFVLDWFTNLEQFLFSGTDFLGLTLHNAYTTVTYRNGLSGNSGSTYPGYEWGQTGASDGVYISRTIGITQPSFVIRPLQAPSWKRAANAVSLLVQFLKK